MPKTIQWATQPAANPLEIALPNQWGWPQIRQLLDEVLLSSDKWETTDSWKEQSRQLYGFLPEGKRELRRIRDNAKRYLRQSWLGTPPAKEILQPYRKKLKAVTWAVRMKLAATLTTTNPHRWSKRAYGLFLDIQQHLAKKHRLHFLTITFDDNPTYAEARHRLRAITRNLLYREGFQSLDVIAFHPHEGENTPHPYSSPRLEPDTAHPLERDGGNAAGLIGIASVCAVRGTIFTSRNAREKPTWLIVSVAASGSAFSAAEPPTFAAASL